ncbi:hypothetical protein BJX63DRAFT_406710, partial [Aspergillus granulosus]
MVLAIQEVRSGGMTCREAANQYGLKQSLLQDRLNRRPTRQESYIKQQKLDEMD